MTHIILSIYIDCNYILLIILFIIISNVLLIGMYNFSLEIVENYKFILFLLKKKET